MAQFKVKRIGYRAMGLDNNFYQFEWKGDDEYLIYKNGCWVEANKGDFIILELCHYVG